MTDLSRRRFLLSVAAAPVAAAAVSAAVVTRALPPPGYVPFTPRDWVGGTATLNEVRVSDGGFLIPRDVYNDLLAHLGDVLPHMTRAPDRTDPEPAPTPASRYAVLRRIGRQHFAKTPEASDVA
ncbi:MAG: hypothetical protein P4L82_12105 [Ancalomicrobiaceae bacterium]|nr:hypothetical protein [Ancalomicrobiaceae bacterium]